MGHELHSRRRWAGVGRVAWMATLVPLLAVLWGVEAQAVTLEGSGAVCGGARCAAAAEGRPSPGELGEGASVLDAGAAGVSGAQGRDGVPAWAQPEVSRESILRLARTAADGDPSMPAGAQLGEDWRALARGALRGSDPEVVVVAARTPLSRPSVVEESLGLWSGGSCAAPRPSRHVVSASTTVVALRWWHSVPLLPGLLALAVSVRGIARNRPSQLLVRC